jgi:hypothetical protein
MTRLLTRIACGSALLGAFVVAWLALRSSPSDGPSGASTEPEIPAARLRSGAVAEAPTRIAAPPASAVASSLRVRVRFEDGEPLANARCLLASSELANTEARRLLTQGGSGSAAARLFVTDANGEALLDQPDPAVARLRVWHDRSRLRQCEQSWATPTTIDAIIPGGLVHVQVVGSTAAQDAHTSCSAVFRSDRHGLSDLEFARDAKPLGTPVSPVWRDTKGFAFYGEGEGFVSVRAQCTASGASASRGNVPFQPAEPADGIQLVLQAPNAGVLELTGADLLIGQSFAVKITGANDYRRVVYSEDLSAGKFVLDVPIGLTQLELMARFVPPAATLRTGEIVELEVKATTQQVAFSWTPCARLRVQVGREDAAPVRVEYRQRGPAWLKASRLGHFNAERRWCEPGAIPVPGVRSFDGPQLSPGPCSVRFVCSDTGDTLKTVELVAPDAGFCDVHYP